MWLLSGIAALLGLASGGAAVGLFKLIGLITHLTLLHDWGTDLPSLRGYHATLWLIPTAIGGALVVSLLAVWAPVIRGHGIPESLETILTKHSRIRPRAAVAKPLSAAVTIGTGGPFGAEGPIIVTGGSIGSLIGQVLSVSPAERKILLATGAASGMAAAFDTPVAAIILAIELVLFERSLRTIVPLMIACSIAAAVHIVAFGSAPLFAVHAVLHVGLLHLPWFVLVGLASGILAVILNKGLFLMEAAFRRLPVKIFWWPLIGALGFSVIGFFVPRTLSMGYSAIVDTLNGRFVLSMVAILLVAKLFSWWIALGSQTSGGTLAPMFLIGALMGSLLGHGVQSLFPGSHISIGAFALAAMAATFGASTKAVLASVVFALEVTGEYRMAIPVLIATAVADLIAQVALTDRVMTEKLSHRGFRVDFRTETDVLRTRLVHHVMHRADALPATLTATAASEALSAASRPGPAKSDGQAGPAVPVCGPHGRYLGLVTAEDLSHADPDAPVHAVVRARTPVLAPTDFLDIALTHLTESGLESLPVVGRDGGFRGMIGRSDILAYRHRARLDAETRQPGWVQARRDLPRPERSGRTQGVPAGAETGSHRRRRRAARAEAHAGTAPRPGITPQKSERPLLPGAAHGQVAHPSRPAPPVAGTSHSAGPSSPAPAQDGRGEE